MQVNILRTLRHPYIVKYYDRILDKARPFFYAGLLYIVSQRIALVQAQSRIYIVMEFCEGGDLGTIIKRCREERLVKLYIA
jgi:NIMA (never in mitosis gene a)-related kinase